MVLNKTTVLLILMAAAVSVALFVVKHSVQDLNDELYGLNRDILGTQETIHVLKSEWSHLNHPDRLRRLAASHLEMGPVGPDQVGSSKAVLEALPARNEVEAAQ